MKEVSYTDRDGRLWATLVPDGARESEADLGVPLGPPSLESLGLPRAIEVRLHNQLYHRRLFGPMPEPVQLQAAIMGAIKLDVQALQVIYAGVEQ